MRRARRASGCLRAHRSTGTAIGAHGAEIVATRGRIMPIETDSEGGHAVGSHIRLGGRVLGLALNVECIVTQREPPRFKAWQTVGTPRLLVIGPYRMSVAIEPWSRRGSRVIITIDYALPQNRIWRWFGPTYARWCVRQMARDLARSFGGSTA